MTHLCIRSTFGRCDARRRIVPFFLSGLIIAVTATPPVWAQNSASIQEVVAHLYDAHIAEASQRFGIPVAWITAVMRAESAGNPHAVSSAGAMGLMQVMPGTWGALRLRYDLGSDPYDPQDNILAGTAYLHEMWDRYGNVGAMLAAYNAGPARYEAYRSTDRPLPAETRAYVAALAPVLLGERPPDSVLATAKPLDWREAAIFVARGENVATTERAEPKRVQDQAPSLALAAPESLPASQSEGLFVARNADGDRP